MAPETLLIALLRITNFVENMKCITTISGLLQNCVSVISNICVPQLV